MLGWKKHKLESITGLLGGHTDAFNSGVLCVPLLGIAALHHSRELPLPSNIRFLAAPNGGL